MKYLKICLLLIIGGIGFSGVIWLLRPKIPQEKIKVYKNTPLPTHTETQAPMSVSHHPHSHPHSGERPSNYMLRLYSEAAVEKGSPKFQRWVAYLESEEGRAFYDSLPSLEEMFEKAKSFGFYQNSPERQAVTDGIYREHFPTGTVDENEHIVRKIITDAILEHELYKEGGLYTDGNLEIIMALGQNGLLNAWLEKKFGSDPIAPTKWFFSTFEEIRLAKREKYFASQNTNETKPTGEFADVERPKPQMELLSEDRQTSTDIREVLNPDPDLERLLENDTEIMQTLTDHPTLEPLPSLELPLSESFDKTLRENFSPERFNRAINTLNRYGPKEGVRRLKESDPEIAKQIERLLPKRQEND